jgi:D-glycero-D-manno-heptose 1,7-bisphosphate phosphatase
VPGCLTVTDRAVFLDRDGVLNPNVFYADTRRWESPRRVEEFSLCPGVLVALRALQGAGYALFLVSNQPNTVNGKSSFVQLAGMHALLAESLGRAGVRLRGAFYCTHAPVVSGACACRKPSPWFLDRAIQAHGLRAQECWMIGDRATDMECGRAAGVRTVWVRTGQEPRVPQPALCDWTAANLPEAVEQILRERTVLQDAAATAPGADAVGGRTIRVSSSE